MATKKTTDVEVEVSKRVTKGDVLEAYNSGLNYYQLAEKFFDSTSEETVARVRDIVENGQ